MATVGCKTSNFLMELHATDQSGVKYLGIKKRDQVNAPAYESSETEISEGQYHL